MDELFVRWSLTRVEPTLLAGSLGLAGSSSSYGGGRYRTGDIFGKSLRNWHNVEAIVLHPPNVTSVLRYFGPTHTF